MIKILDCKSLNYLSKLKLILEKRRLGSKINTSIVSKIVKDVKKNKQKALLKYEKKFSKNKVVKISSEYKLDVDPDELIEKLPVGIQQRVEIIKPFENSNGRRS